MRVRPPGDQDHAAGPSECLGWDDLDTVPRPLEAREDGDVDRVPRSGGLPAQGSGHGVQRRRKALRSLSAHHSNKCTSECLRDNGG